MSGSLLANKNQNIKNTTKVCTENKHHLKPTFETISSYFLSRGVKILFNESTYKNNKTPLYYLCPKCGKESWTNWTTIKTHAPTLLCKDCCSRAKLTREKIQLEFEKRGAQLIWEKFPDSFSNNQKFWFYCTVCGGEHYISWKNLISNKNKNMLCHSCARGKRLNPLGSFSKDRYNIDGNWYRFVCEFFNITWSKYRQQSEYTSHHIVRRSIRPELSNSIVNGYPLKYSEHKGKFSFYHSLDGKDSPVNWPEEAKLPYHTYSTFKFLDLNKKMLTTFILAGDALTPAELYNQKKDCAGQGILFIPIYFEEMYIGKKAQIIYSMIRNRLWKWFPDIYKYTGQQFTQYQARKLILEEISSQESREFLDNNHIQGFVGAKVTIVLKDNDEIVALMSFGTPRVQNHYEWELLRFCSKINSFVAGGAQKLFKAFINKYNPSNIVSYCDIRFSSLNPDETVYPKLGFKYDGRTQPNYKYYHPDYNRLFSRQQFQKHKLKEKLDNFDPNLSEAENMSNNGYIRQYDCGNFRFIWNKEN